MPAAVRRGLLHGLTLAGLAFLVYLFVVLAPLVRSVGYDAFAYWNVDLAQPYAVPLGGLGSFPYPPPAALVASFFGVLPFWVFLWLWLALLVGTAFFLGGRWALVVLAFPPVALELYHANIHLLLAAAIVLGFRHPWTWSFVLLTKASCGVGLLWFVVRREWRSLAIALGSTAVLVALSVLVVPQLWPAWVDFLLQEPDGTVGGPSVPVPLWMRVLAAAALITWGARTDRRWTVLVGATLALPVLWLAGFAMLAGLAVEARRLADARRPRPTEPTMQPMPDTPSLTIVVPAYNEAERIGPALGELFGYLGRVGPAREGGRSATELGAWDVLVVDDGSDDDTAALVEARPEATASDGVRPRLRVLRRPHAGKGAAVRAGVLAATGDLVVFTDADMATPPDQIPLLTEALRDHEVALGSRVQPDGSDRRASQPLHRRLLGKVFHLVAGLWVTGSVPDTQCGFKGFHRTVGVDLFERQRITSIVFDAEIIHLARRRGYRIAVVPVQWTDKRGSRMRVRASLGLRVLYDLARIPLLHRGVGRATRTEPAKVDPA
jgi:hypothetical protein